MEIQFQNNFTAVSKCMIFEKRASTVSENVVSKGIPYEVTISKEGFDSYRKSIQNDLVEEKNLDMTAYKEYLTKSIIDISGQTQAMFHSQLRKMNTQMIESKGDCDALGLASNCFAVYTQMYDEIKRGYAEGTREFWVVDAGAENGFRKVTEEEELEALDAAYDFYAQVVDAYVNHGMKASETIADAVSRLQADIENQEYIREVHQEKQDKGMDNLYEKLLLSASTWKKKYLIGAENLVVLFNQIFNEKFSDL